VVVCARARQEQTEERGLWCFPLVFAVSHCGDPTRPYFSILRLSFSQRISPSRSIDGCRSRDTRAHDTASRLLQSFVLGCVPSRHTHTHTHTHARACQLSPMREASPNQTTAKPQQRHIAPRHRLLDTQRRERAWCGRHDRGLGTTSPRWSCRSVEWLLSRTTWRDHCLYQGWFATVSRLRSTACVPGIAACDGGRHLERLVAADDAGAARARRPRCHTAVGRSATHACNRLVAHARRHTPQSLSIRVPRPSILRTRRYKRHRLALALALVYTTTSSSNTHLSLQASIHHTWPTTSLLEVAYVLGVMAWVIYAHHHQANAVCSEWGQTRLVELPVCPTARERERERESTSGMLLDADELARQLCAEHDRDAQPKAIADHHAAHVSAARLGRGQHCVLLCWVLRLYPTSDPRWFQRIDSLRARREVRALLLAARFSPSHQYGVAVMLV